MNRVTTTLRMGQHRPRYLTPEMYNSARPGLRLALYKVPWTIQASQIRAALTMSGAGSTKERMFQNMEMRNFILFGFPRVIEQIPALTSARQPCTDMAFLVSPSERFRHVAVADKVMVTYCPRESSIVRLKSTERNRDEKMSYRRFVEPVLSARFLTTIKRGEVNLHYSFTHRFFGSGRAHLR